MKNNLFKKFLAVFLTGTMLTGVGCKDYDDDIDSINKRLDGMDVTLSSLPEQLDAIKKSIPDISSLTSKVATLENKLEGVTDLKGQLEKLNKLEGTLKKYVDDEVGKATTAEALKKTLGNYYATASALTDLETALDAITKKDGKIDAAIAAAIQNLRDKDIADLKANSGDWMGPKIQDYLSGKGYAFTKGEATNAASAEVLAQIKNEQSEYRKTIEGIISTAEITNLGTGIVKSENLDIALKALIEKIEPLIARVAELEGRIQSLVFVPSSLEEATDNVIYFEGASYIQMDPTTKHWLGSNKQPEAKLVFRVSPAALVEKINSKNVDVVVEKVTRAASLPQFTVKVQDQDKENGKFTVIISTDYKFGENKDETLAIALHVNIAPASESESKYGIDYTSAYIGTDYKTGGDITSKLVIAKAPAEEGGSYVKLANNGTFNSELEYNSTKTVTFMEDFDVYYNPEGTKFHKLADMWANAPVIEKKAATADAVASAHAANYTLSKTTAAIKTSTTDLIGDKITSKPVTFNVKAAGKTLKIGAANEEISIVGINTDVTAPNATLMWKYAIAKSDAAARNVYTADQEVALDKVNNMNMLKSDLYKKMASYTNSATLQSGQYVVEITKDGQAVQGITADVKLTSTPSLDTDGQLVKVMLTGDLKESATYDIKATYMHADKTTATIEMKAVVTGMPELATKNVYTIPVASKTYMGNFEFELLKDFANAVWNDALKGAFADKAEFTAAIYGATATPAKNGKATLSKANQNIQVIFDNDAAYATSYKPSIKFVDAKGTGLEVTFKSDVKLIEPTAALTKNATFFGDDGKAITTTSLSGATFNVVNKPLMSSYYYGGDIPGTKIVYKLDETTADLKALTDKGLTIPSIDATNVLMWNDWNKLDLKVKAELQLNGKVLDTKPFIVKINDPLAAAITVDTKVDATIYAGEATKTFQVAQMLDLKAQDDRNVFDSSVAATGLNVDLKSAFDGEVEYTSTNINPIITVDKKSGVVTLTTDGSLEILNPIQVNVTANYKYQFGVRSKTVTVVVKSGTKPAPAPAN